LVEREATFRCPGGPHCSNRIDTIQRRSI
jgi:hypothetical protein